MIQSNIIIKITKHSMKQNIIGPLTIKMSYTLYASVHVERGVSLLLRRLMFDMQDYACIKSICVYPQ